MKTSIHVLIGTIAVAGILAGCGTPQSDTGLQERFSDASYVDLPSIIAKSAENMGVTAQAVTIIDGSDEPLSFYSGRADADALMQAASMSKAVAAACILTLAERKGVALDDDISSQITSLDVKSLKGGDRPITLRQLLSHTSGSSQSGYSGYKRGTDLPTTAQTILNPPGAFEKGLTFSANVGQFEYSGGGYMLAQLWAEDVSGQGFADLADDLILVPLGMTHSTFKQPLDPDDILPLRVAGADIKADPANGFMRGVENGWRDYPEQAAAGLWTTSEDYARFVVALMDSARGEETALSLGVAASMITPEVVLSDNHRYGLGVQIIVKEDGSIRFVTHSGINAGYRALFSVRPNTDDVSRRVVVSLSNTEAGEALNEAIVYALTDR